MIFFTSFSSASLRRRSQSAQYHHGLQLLRGHGRLRWFFAWVICSPAIRNHIVNSNGDWTVSVSRGFRHSLRKKAPIESHSSARIPVTLVKPARLGQFELDAPYNQQHNCERPHKNGWRKVAGFLMCCSATGRHGGPGSPFLRFPIVRRAGRDAAACGFSQHHAVPDLLDGAFGRRHPAVHCVLLRLPPSPPDLTAADSSAVLSRVISVIRTSSCY